MTANLYLTYRALFQRDYAAKIITGDEFVDAFKQLAALVLDLDVTHEDIVSAILNFDLFGCSQEVLDAYSAFIVTLAGQQVYYTHAILSAIAKRFVPKLQHLNNVSLQLSETLEAYEKIYDHSRDLLVRLLRVVPLAREKLLPAMQQNFPYMRRDEREIQAYTINMFKLLDLFPDLRQEILLFLFEEFLKIDVHASREDIEAAEAVVLEEEQDYDVGCFEMDTNDTGDESSQSSERTKHDLGRRLDLCMTVTFQYIQNTCLVEGKLSFGPTKILYRQLWHCFNKCILPVYASHHVQFALFYMCSLAKGLWSHFLDGLWQIVQDPNVSHVCRQSASCYMAGLLCRARYIDIKVAKGCLVTWVEWLNQYIDSQDSTDVILHDNALLIHSAFYSLCQAVFYVFAFRHSEFLSEGRIDYKYLRQLNFERIVKCSLNPLRFCNEVVVKQFTSIVRNFQLAYCDTIVERNKRQLAYRGVVRLVPSPLECFFPFDPYVLKSSAPFIKPEYREYRGMAEDEMDEDDDEPSSRNSFSRSPATVLLYGTSPGFRYG